MGQKWDNYPMSEIRIRNVVPADHKRIVSMAKRRGMTLRGFCYAAILKRLREIKEESAAKRRKEKAK